MPSPVFAPLPLGSKAAAADVSTTSLLRNLGLRISDGLGNEYVLAEAGASITAAGGAGGRWVTFTITGSSIVYRCALTAALNSPNVAGVIDPALTENLADGDVFWVQRAGEVDALATTAINAAGLLAGTITTTPGAVAATVVASSTTGIVAVDRAVARSLAARVTTTGKAKFRLMNIH